MKEKFVAALFIGLFLCTLSSCDQFDPASINGDVYGDVFIKAQFTEDVIHYSPVFYAYANQKMDKVEVYHTDFANEVYVLDSLDFGYTFARFPANEMLSTEIPRAGTYRFIAIFQNGAQSISTDEVSNKVISPPTITKTEYNPSIQRLTINWEADTNAQNHKVTLLNSEGEIAYESDLLNSKTATYSVSIHNQGWFETPTKNPYNVVVQSYLFEGELSAFDLQCLAVNNLVFINWE